MREKYPGSWRSRVAVPPFAPMVLKKFFWLLRSFLARFF